MTPDTEKSPIKAVFFDFMGTCLDWHTNIVNTLPNHLPVADKSKLAIDWRESFFEEIALRFRERLPTEDIDETHRRTLDRVLSQHPDVRNALTSRDKEDLVQAWHSMRAWPEVASSLQALTSRYEIFVLANGTTRLQLDLTRSSGLRFNMLFSSELLGLTKPAPEMYLRALELVKVKPEESVMVAAHAYDLRAARQVGMKTVYIRRWTEDTREDMERIRGENDAFLEDMEALGETVDKLAKRL